MTYTFRFRKQFIYLFEMFHGIYFSTGGTTKRLSTDNAQLILVVYVYVICHVTSSTEELLLSLYRSA